MTSHRCSRSFGSALSACALLKRAIQTRALGSMAGFPYRYAEIGWPWAALSKKLLSLILARLRRPAPSLAPGRLLPPTAGHRRASIVCAPRSGAGLHPARLPCRGWRDPRAVIGAPATGPAAATCGVAWTVDSTSGPLGRAVTAAATQGYVLRRILVWRCYLSM